MPLRPILLLAAAPAIAYAVPGEAPADAPVRLAQLTIHERLVIRVPRVRRGDAPPAVEWKEKKSVKCIAATAVTGAAVNEDGAVDLVLDGLRRVRAELDDRCPALAFYSGFYLKPGPDGEVCARRDAFRSRSGAACAIRRLRMLVPRIP